jgi:hypothetical protein
MDISRMLDQYPMVVNHFKGKIERIRKEKVAKGEPPELTKEDIQPVLDEALKWISANVPAGIKKPKNMEQLIDIVINSGVGKKFGLSDAEVAMIGETVAQELPAEGMPEGISQGMPQEIPPEILKKIQESRVPMPMPNEIRPQQRPIMISKPAPPPPPPAAEKLKWWW